MVSVVPSIIPILTANAVAANQVKRKNKSLNNKEKKLKDSPINDKVNCRVFLNNGKVIEGHYEGNWYEDNSDEEGIWIKTDDGTKEINSKDYDRVEYYHKKTVNEAYIKAEKGNIYYTKNSDMFLSMVKSIFISKNIPVRVYYDTIKQMYVFGNAFDYIHADLATGMKYYSKIYGVDEMRANISYLKQNCALFQVLPDDNFKAYDVGDGYSSGWFLKLDDLIFACRNKEYEKVRDNVPLFKDHIGEWKDVQYYLNKKNNINESVEYIEGIEVLINPTKQELNGFMKKNKVYRVLLTDNDMAIWTADCSLCHLDVEGEYPEFNNSEHLFALNGNLFFDDYDMPPDEIEDFYFEDAEKLDNLPIVKEYFPRSQMKKALEMMKKGISVFNTPNKWNEWLNESDEDKILYIIRGVPGSGKSTLAHKLTDNVVEADQYFYDDEGNYNWSADKLNQAHKWCFNTVKKYMEEGRDKIAVANTFVKNKDYKRYVELAKEFGYKVDIRTCTGNYQNIHNVPDETVEKMRSKFQKAPLDESIAYASKKDLSDIILMNPTKKELKDNNLVQCRCMEDGEGNWYFADMENMLHCYMEHSLRDETYFPYYDGNDSYGISYYDAGTNEFWYNPNEMMTKQECINQYKNSEYLRTTFPNARVIQNPWGDQGVDDLYEDEEEQLDESAENDKTLRDYAVKLANICLDAIVKTKYKSYFTKTQLLIDVDKEFKKACPILKKSSHEYFLSLSDKEETYPYFSKTTDGKFGVITLPIVPKNPYDYAWDLLMKHKSMLNKILSTYQGTEQSEKIKDLSAKYLKKALEKTLPNIQHRLKDALIHECTHLIDDIRRSQTYKPKKQEIDTDKGKEEYYNSPIEQNAYYQETVSIFDEWVNQSFGYKTFDIFWNDFIKQYRGKYNLLNDKNKRKLKKRAYAYWYVYMKD